MKYAFNNFYSRCLMVLSLLTSFAFALALITWGKTQFLGAETVRPIGDLGWVCVILFFMILVLGAASVFLGFILSPGEPDQKRPS